MLMRKSDESLPLKLSNFSLFNIYTDYDIIARAEYSTWRRLREPRRECTAAAREGERAASLFTLLIRSHIYTHTYEQVTFWFQQAACLNDISLCVLADSSVHFDWGSCVTPARWHFRTWGENQTLCSLTFCIHAAAAATAVRPIIFPAFCVCAPNSIQPFDFARDECLLFVRYLFIRVRAADRKIESEWATESRRAKDEEWIFERRNLFYGTPKLDNEVVQVLISLHKHPYV